VQSKRFRLLIKYNSIPASANPTYMLKFLGW